MQYVIMNSQMLTLYHKNYTGSLKSSMYIVHNLTFPLTALKYIAKPIGQLLTINTHTHTHTQNQINNHSVCCDSEISLPIFANRNEQKTASNIMTAQNTEKVIEPQKVSKASPLCH